MPDDPAAKVGVSGKPKQEYREPRFAELDAQIVADENAAVRAKGQRTQKRKPGTMRLRGPAKTLFDDAVKAARELKRKHRLYYDTDLRGFRATVRKAHSRVFRLKPGPKPDTRIATAARERAAGATWQSLYPKYIDHYSEMPKFTCALAEEGFRRKVNGYLQRHRRLRRQVTPPGGSRTN